MGFFFTQATPQPVRNKRSVHIPIQTMRSMGCTACPRAKDNRDLVSPVMQPNGPVNAELMVLHAAPRSMDDAQGGCGFSEAQAFIGRLLRAYDAGDVVHHAIIQCADNSDSYNDAFPEEQETECCRGYIEQHIAAHKPRVIVGVGDAPLQWIKGVLSGKGQQLKAPVVRGSLIACHIAGHSFWYMPIMFPKFLKDRKPGRKSEYELAMEHDLRKAAAIANDLDYPPPSVVLTGYEDGVQVVTGASAQDFQLIEEHLHWALQQDETGLDYETNGLRPFLLKEPLLLSAAVGTFERTMAFPLMHPAGWISEHQRKRAVNALGDYLRQANSILCHNASFELEWTNYWYGAQPLRYHEWHDTMAMAHSINEQVAITSLGCQTRMVFGFNLKSLSNIDTKNIINAPLREALLYNGMDTKWTCALAEVLRWEIDNVHQWCKRDYARKVELAPTLALVTAKGMKVSREAAATQERELELKQREIERAIQATPEVRKYAARFGAFSPTNNDHVLTLMKTICQRPEVRIEDWKGNVTYTTNEDEALSKIPGDEVPSAPLILDHRSNEKLLGTYIRKITNGAVVSAATGSVHSQYSSMRATTGRLASDDPNVQNIPVRTEEGKRVREAFIPDFVDQVFVKADYGQIEARVLGCLTQDRKLVRYQWTNYDIHAVWAQRMIDLYPKVKDWIVRTLKIDWDAKGFKALRQEAKNKWVFPQFFGSSVQACADSLHIPIEIAEQLAREFWDEFQDVHKWQEDVLRIYEKNLYVETMNGHRRTAPLRKEQIINAPIQGTAAEVVTAAMIELGEYAYLHDDQQFIPNLNVHDDLSTMMWKSQSGRGQEFEKTLEQYVRIMCRHRFDWIVVPLLVEVEIGPNWGKTTKYKEFSSKDLYNLENPYA